LVTHQTNDIHFHALDRQRLERDEIPRHRATISEEVNAA